MMLVTWMPIPGSDPSKAALPKAKIPPSLPTKKYPAPLAVGVIPTMSFTWTPIPGTGYLDREREGRRNVYRVRSHLPLRLPFQRDLDVKSLLAIMATEDELSGVTQESDSSVST